MWTAFSCDVPGHQASGQRVPVHEDRKRSHDTSFKLTSPASDMLKSVWTSVTQEGLLESVVKQARGIPPWKSHSTQPSLCRDLGCDRPFRCKPSDPPLPGHKRTSRNARKTGRSISSQGVCEGLHHPKATELDEEGAEFALASGKQHT